MTRRFSASARTALAALLCLSFGACQPASADTPSNQAETFVTALHPATCTVAIGKAHAHLSLAPGYGFLDAHDAQRVLSNLWRNPPDKDVLGMILPSSDPNVLLDESSWAVVVTYIDDGYVSDADAAGIDYGKMLADMKDATHDRNPERRKQGYPEIELAGWAEPPHYDASNHKLYWARDLIFQRDGHSGHSLNYDIRVPGRAI